MLTVEIKTHDKGNERDEREREIRESKKELRRLEKVRVRKS